MNSIYEQMIEVSWNWSCLPLHIDKEKCRIFLIRWILGVCIYPLSINHSLVMIYHYMFYMYTCKHHSQVFICSSSFRSSILRFIVCGQNPLKHLKGQTIVLHTLCLCAHIPHSHPLWWVGPYQRKIYQISV